VRLCDQVKVVTKDDVVVITFRHYLLEIIHIHTMSAVPAFDLKLDELNIALGYATIGGGEISTPSDAVAKAMNIQAPAKKAAAPKAAKKEAKVRSISRILGIPDFSVIWRAPWAYQCLLKFHNLG
jgi:hypothetical protein